ncbi:alpha/beta fold hydrolase [Streptomyces sp. TRM72054]|uniref:alpha/beta fold hydrolase n=1 Tax=Streptomyces sp. TRM72054 TaxID=2870562 RepID=UPI001C8CD28F|nr:alpha/beta hydrolase [Streptomyces sp. TRM72054]MBX9393947.1 alpha/beta fold hydrolase [Streptomyces sp. TRM72054]
MLSRSFLAAYDAVLSCWPGPVDCRELPTVHGVTRVNSVGPVDADRPPLVLLPGGGATSTVWGAAVAAGLAEGRRVHAVDLVGDPGLSVPAPGRTIRSIGDLVGWLDALLDGLGAAGEGSRVDLLGHSYGAWIAAHYAAHAPHRLDRLVLLDPTAVFTGFRPGYLLRALPMLLRPTPTRIRRFLEWETGGAQGIDPDWLRLQEETAQFPSQRPVTGPRPDPTRLRDLDVLVLFAGRARCHDPHRAAAVAARVLPDAVVDVLDGDGVSHHAMPLAAAGPIAARLAV